MGDNGLSGKNLVVDHYGPGAPIGAVPCAARIRTRSTAQGRPGGGLAARQLAVRLVAGGHGRSAAVWLDWFPRSIQQLNGDSAESCENHDSADAQCDVAADFLTSQVAG
jgi:hypothetical protein